MTAHDTVASLRRRTLLAGGAMALLLGVAPTSALAQDVSGELVILQWQGGTDAEMWKEIEAAFVAKNPGVTIRELVVTGQGECAARCAPRCWAAKSSTSSSTPGRPSAPSSSMPASCARSTSSGSSSAGSTSSSQSWKDLGSIDGATYGVTYTYGDRSGDLVQARPHLEKAGIEPPKTWDEFLASFDKLKAAGYATPVAIGAKYWAHAEWFETLLLRTAGVETAAKLAAHEIPWTDPTRQDGAQEVCRDAQGRLLRHARGDARQRLGRTPPTRSSRPTSRTTCSSACGSTPAPRTTTA